MKIILCCLGLLLATPALANSVEDGLPQAAGAGEASVALKAVARMEPQKERPPRVDWAELLRKTFDFDVFACVSCGGRRSVLAYVKQARGV